jgi:hypothetical protein
MDERTRGRSKIDSPKSAGPRGGVWFGAAGDGLRRLLNRIFLRPGRIWSQSSKVERVQEGAMPGIPTNFFFWAETTWSFK